MRSVSSSSVLGSLSLVSLGLMAGSCGLLSGALSKPPTVVSRSWRSQTVLVEPGNAELGRPSVFIDGQGQPAVALADRAFYVGMQSVAVGRRSADGWRVEFPLTPAAWRVCGAAGPGDAVTVTFGELDGPLRAVAWDGAAGTAEQTTPGPCPQTAPNVREVTAAGLVHQLELSKDEQTLWHSVSEGTPCGPHDAEPGQRFEAFGLTVDDQGSAQIAVFERASQGERGRLRHAVCTNGEWVTSVVADEVVVRDVGLTVGPGGLPHVVYVAEGSGSLQLVYAGLADASGAAPAEPPLDARVRPAVDACLRLEPTPPTGGAGIERYQTGDGFRCAVLERDAEPPAQAAELLRSRCDAGEADACAVAGALHHRLMGDAAVVLTRPDGGRMGVESEWSGLRASGVPSDPEQAGELYGQACTRGNARACVHAAILVPSGHEQRAAWADAACRAGLASGCAVAVAFGGRTPNRAQVEKAVAGLRDACAADDRAACASLGSLLILQGDEAAARAPLERACEAQVQTACQSLGQ